MSDPVVAWLGQLADAVRWTVDLIGTGLTQNTEAMMKTIKSYYPVTIVIDDDPVKLHIRRMPTIEIEEFETTMRGFGYSFDGRRAIPPPNMNTKELAVWLVKVITENITVPEGQLVLEDPDGTARALTTGSELIATFGGRVDFVPTLIAFIWGENRLPEKNKAVFRETAANAVAAALVQTPAELPPVEIPLLIVPVAEIVEPATSSDALSAQDVVDAVSDIRRVHGLDAEGQPSLLQ